MKLEQKVISQQIQTEDFVDRGIGKTLAEKEKWNLNNLLQKARHYRARCIEYRQTQSMEMDRGARKPHAK